MALWSIEEKRLLHENYPLKPLSDLLILLPNRSKNAIILKAFEQNIKSLRRQPINGEPYKICRKCLQTKQIDDFEPCGIGIYRRNVCFDCRREQRNTLTKEWGLTHRDLRLKTYKESNRRQWIKNRGIPEFGIYPQVVREFPDASPLYLYHPDFYHNGVFIEIKMASIYRSKRSHFNLRSKYFPELYFRSNGHGLGTIDDKIIFYPKPLLIIIFDKDTGKELVRRRFD